MYLISKNANYLEKPNVEKTIDEFIEELVLLGYERYDLETPFNWVGYYLVDYGIKD